jgi:hypothetical protein
MPEGFTEHDGHYDQGNGIGERPFDVPMLERGYQPHPEPHCREVTNFIHPPVETPVSKQQREAFRAMVKKDRYRYWGHGQDLGIYEDQVVLLDPWAVRRGN